MPIYDADSMGKLSNTVCLNLNGIYVVEIKSKSTFCVFASHDFFYFAIFSKSRHGVGKRKAD